jgi:hypothetical protein
MTCKHGPWAIVELAADHPDRTKVCCDAPREGATVWKTICGSSAERKCEECNMLLCRDHGQFQDEIDTQKITVE